MRYRMDSLRFIFKLSSLLSLCIPIGPSPSGLPTKAFYAPLPCPTRATCPHPFHSSRFDHSNNIWRVVHVTKLLNMQFSLFPCYLFRLKSENLRHRPISKYRQLTFPPLQCETKVQILFTNILTFIFLESKLESKRF